MNYIIQYLPEDVAELMELYFFPSALASIILCCLYAIYSYKLLKISMAITGASVFGAVGNIVVGPIVTEAIGGALPDAINIDAIIGLVCALIGAILGRYAYKVVVFIAGAAGGYVAGASLVCMLGEKIEFLQNEIAALVISIVCALIVAIIAVLLFKPLYLIVTTVGNMICVGALIGMVVVPDATTPLVLGIFAAIGLIAGIIVAVKQFRIAAED